MKEYLKNNALLILITIILFCNLTVEIAQFFILNDIKNRTGVPNRFEFLLEDIRNFNKSILWDLQYLNKKI